MELLTRTIEATAQELVAIAGVLGVESGQSSPRLRRRGASRRTLLLPVLHALRDEVGYISEGAVQEISEQLEVPRADIYGVASFYALLPTEQQPASTVHVCVDMACRFAGGEQLLEEVRSEVDAAEVAVHESPCLGQCENAPAVYMEKTGESRSSITEAISQKVIESLNTASPQTGAESSGTSTAMGGQASYDSPAEKAGAEGSGTSTLRAYSIGEPLLLRRIINATPPTLEGYGDFLALRAALENGREWVLENIEASQLRGRGGAAFPAAIKWRAVGEAQESVRYVVANADESEPGTFKDRLLMESDPFAIIEAMAIAGYATGAQKGYIYVRDEYPLACARIEQACREAQAAGLLGENPGSGDFSFHIELRRGAGAYICGEETALFNSIEGYRGEPRNKPPFPTESGLFGKPTLVNNVETFANIPLILNEGAQAFAQIGTEQSRGTRLFCVSGGCERPGTYEAPLGTSLSDLLEAAGATDSARVLLGGAAGAFAPQDYQNIPLSFEHTTAASLTLGSGAVIVIDTKADMGDLLGRITDFFADESCGQCVPCRVGTVRQQESVARIRSNGHNPDELALLDDLDAVMTDASICGLGQTAASALRSARHANLF